MRARGIRHPLYPWKEGRRPRCAGCRPACAQLASHPGSCVMSGPGPRVLLRIPLRGRVCQGRVEVQVEFGRPRTALALILPGWLCGRSLLGAPPLRLDAPGLCRQPSKPCPVCLSPESRRPPRLDLSLDAYFSHSYNTGALREHVSALISDAVVPGDQ